MECRTSVLPLSCLDSWGDLEMLRLVLRRPDRFTDINATRRCSGLLHILIKQPHPSKVEEKSTNPLTGCFNGLLFQFWQKKLQYFPSVCLVSVSTCDILYISCYFVCWARFLSQTFPSAHWCPPAKSHHPSSVRRYICSADFGWESSRAFIVESRKEICLLCYFCAESWFLSTLRWMFSHTFHWAINV